MTASRTIRLFVSSTFADMKAERDILQRDVFPKLKQLCLSKGLRFQAIDLRWGVSEEAGRHNRTMRICLRELKRCQEGAPKPNFLILLGDRYGWRPLPETINADLFERLLQNITADHTDGHGYTGTSSVEISAIRGPNSDVAALLRTCYRRDNNAVPPTYILQPRQDDDARWYGIVEPALLSALQRAAVAIGSDPHLEALAIGLSATHQEIIHGALAVSDAREHVHAFFRTIRYPPGQQPIEDFVDHLPTGAPDPDAPNRLARLKENVTRHIGTSNVHGYTLDWREQGSFTDDDLAEFRETIYRALESVILNQITQLESIPPEQQEENAHRDFGQERRDGFVGRGALLDRVAAHLATGTGRPLAVLGPGGSGKSAFMAKAIEQARAAHPDATIIERYIGATTGSSDIITLLRDIVTTIRRTYPKSRVGVPPASPQSRTGVPPASPQSGVGVPPVSSEDPGQAGSSPQPRDENVPFEYNPLIAALQEALQRPTAAAPLFVFLDALDQLSDTHQAHQLNWLPATIPHHVNLIVSAASPAEVRSSDFSRSDSSDGKAEPPKGGTPNKDLLPAVFEALSSRIAVNDRIILDKLSREHGEQMLDHWLGNAKRTLQPTQREAVLRIFTIEGSPLWLRTATTEAARYADWQILPEFPPETTGLMRHILEKLSAKEEHGEVLVSRALGYLACARHGLAEDEMLDVLSADKAVMENFRERYPKSPPVRSLPVAVWVAFRGDIAVYLAEHDAQQARLMRFYHRSFREAVEGRYLADSEKRRAHQKLAEYFARIDEPVGRKLAELPWQWAQAECWDKLYDLLINWDFFIALWDAAQFEVGSYWTQLEKHSRYRMEEGYQSVLRNVSAHAADTWRLAILLKRGGHLREAAQVHLEETKVFERANDPIRLAASLTSLALVMQSQGELGVALDAFARAERIYRITDNDLSAILLAETLGGEAIVLEQKGDYDRAETLHQEAEHICRQFKIVPGIINAIEGQARIRLAKGNSRDALKLLRENEILCRNTGESEGLQRCLGDQALVLLKLGQFGEALAAAQAKKHICESFGYLPGVAYALGTEGTIREAERDYRRALAAYTQCVDVFRQIGEPAGLAMALYNQCRLVSLSGGTPADEKRLFDEAVQIASTHGLTSLLSQMDRGQPLKRKRSPKSVSKTWLLAKIVCVGFHWLIGLGLMVSFLPWPGPGITAPLRSRVAQFLIAAYLVVEGEAYKRTASLRQPTEAFFFAGVCYQTLGASFLIYVGFCHVVGLPNIDFSTAVSRLVVVMFWYSPIAVASCYASLLHRRNPNTSPNEDDQVR